MSSNSQSNREADKKKFLIMHINRQCRSNWTPKEEKNGKDIEIKWSDVSAALKLLPLYTEKGWIVSHQVMLDKRGRTLIIKMKKPPKPNLSL